MSEASSSRTTTCLMCASESASTSGKVNDGASGGDQMRQTVRLSSSQLTLVNTPASFRGSVMPPIEMLRPSTVTSGGGTIVPYVFVCDAWSGYPTVSQLSLQ